MKNFINNTKIATEEEIRTAIDGYSSLFPATIENEFFRSFKRGWLNIQSDFEKHKNTDQRTSFMLIMRAARDQRDELYERCSIQLKNIEQAKRKFQSTFEEFHPLLRLNKAEYLIQILNMWSRHRPEYGYALIINFTRLGLRFSTKSKLEINHPSKTIGNFIKKNIDSLEEDIERLCLSYGTYWGTESAMALVSETGKLPNCNEYITKDWGEFDFSLEQQKDKSLMNLLNMGHLVDAAVKIRFISLSYNKNYSHQESYDIISQEMEEIGYCVSQYLPEEPKTLADRARRYREKHFAEISSLSKN